MGRSDEYKANQEAQAQATQAISDYNNQAKTAYQNSQQYVGQQGYENALAQGQKGAAQAANASVGASTTAGLQAGLSKAQAAAMGNQSALGSYASQLNNQQQQAYNSGLDAVNVEQQKLNAAANTAGLTSTDAQLKGQDLDRNRSFGFDVAGATVGGIGAAGQTAMGIISDKRTKTYEDSRAVMAKLKKEDSGIVKRVKGYN